jgi:hypothetical protein
VIAAGDLVDAGYWSEELPRLAPDLATTRFVDIQGAANEEDWVTLQITRPDHPVLEILAGEQNPFLKRLKFYQHWQLETLTDRSDVIATFSNGDPAIVQTGVGLGQIIVLAMPVDTEWSTWPSNPSYVVTMQQLVQQLARPRREARNLRVGDDLWFPLDTSRFRSGATLLPPESLDGEPLAAQPAVEGDGVGLAWPELDRVGGWRLLLQTHEGEEEMVTLATNIAADESLADRAAPHDLKSRLTDLPVVYMESVSLSASDDAGGKIDLARACAYLAMLALIVEQLLTWRFTQRRLG